VVGLFIGISTFFLWYATLYYAQIIVGTLVGQWLLGHSRETWPLIGRMAVGVVIVRSGVSVTRCMAILQVKLLSSPSSKGALLMAVKDDPLAGIDLPAGCQKLNGRNALGFDSLLLRGQKLAAHLSERGAQLSYFAAPSGNNRVRKIARGERLNSGHQIIEWQGNRAGHRSEQKRADN